MSDTFENFSDVKIIECDDFLSILPSFVPAGNILLVTSKGFTKRGLRAKVVNKFAVSRISVFDDVTPNPEKIHLQSSMSEFTDSNIEHVIALGGGSVIDAAKVFCALLSHADKSLDELLIADSVENKINLIAIPTTSGTGAEVTPFATVWQSDTAKKHSLYGIRPNVALLDSSLTLSLPFEETLYPALDTLSHALESLWNKHKTNQSQGYAKQAINYICQSLPKVLSDPKNVVARSDLQRAATLAGMAISITRTAIAHALSYPLTARYAVPHGLACSFTLSAIIDVIGYETLELPEALATQVTVLLVQLDLGIELEKYATWSQVQQLSNVPIDASRAGNFIAPIDNPIIHAILLKSQQLMKQGDLL
jgi:phosphonate metabolism-associated iron-containing alcohol dehydrogenase